MLDFLEDNNPLIRNSSKNWLLDSISTFERILDPILKNLLQTKITTFDSNNFQYFYS